jgi:hypothetical protein
MTQDPIVAEVRAIRDQIFKECGQNLKKLAQFLQSQRKQLGLKTVRLHPQPSPLNKTGQPKVRKKVLSGK